MPYVKFAFLGALVLFLYYREISSMVTVWFNDEAYSHGFLIPLISGYLVWTKRDLLRTTLIGSDSKGFFLLLIGIMLLLIGNAAFEQFTMRVSLLVTVSGLIYILMGKRMFEELMFPLGYLIFMIPFPYIIMKNIAVGLKLFNAKITYKVISLSGIPILQEGANLELPNISLVVGDFCTGVLSIVAISAISVLYAYLTQKKMVSRIILVVLALPIAIFSNTVRLISTVILAYYFGEKALGSFFHQFHGTVNFLFTILFLALVGKFIRRIDEKVTGGVLS